MTRPAGGLPYVPSLYAASCAMTRFDPAPAPRARSSCRAPRSALLRELKPMRVRAEHRPGDPALAPLEQGAALVDQEVVADVVPLVAAHVVRLDAADDRRRVGAAVAVGAGRVVHEEHLHVAGVLRRCPDDRLVGAPPGPGDHGRRGPRWHGHRAAGESRDLPRCGPVPRALGPAGCGWAAPAGGSPGLIRSTRSPAGSGLAGPVGGDARLHAVRLADPERIGAARGPPRVARCRARPASPVGLPGPPPGPGPVGRPPGAASRPRRRAPAAGRPRWPRPG